MSNIPGGASISTVVDPIVDFNSKPSYLAHDNKVDSVFLNILPIQNYSSSLITFKLNLSNAMSQVLDRVMVMTVPIRFQISGSRVGAVGTPKLLADGEFGVRSNAFLKVCNVSTINLGTSASVSFNTDSGLVINALEASSPMLMALKQLNNIDSQMCDNVANYDDVLYTNRSVLGLYANNTGSQMGRAAYDITVESNTPTAATLLVRFRFAVFVSPLLQELHVNGGMAGISHVDSLTLNFALTNLATRLLSFARRTNNGRLQIDNIQPLFGPNVAGLPNPQVEFATYNIISQYFQLPPQVNYPLPIFDRYTNLVSVPVGTQSLVSLPVVSLNTVPSYCLLFCTYPENLYSSQNFSYGAETNIHGSQLTDSFASIRNIQAQINSVNQQNNSTQISLWKSYVRNGGSKTFVEWSGLPVIKSVLGESPTYLYPSGSVVKLNFGTDLHVRSPDGTSLSPGTSFKFNASFNMQVFNTLPYSEQLIAYVVYVYPQVLSLSGVNASQITISALSIDDNLSFKGQNPTGHYSQLNTHDLMGYGLTGGLHKLMSHPRMAHKIKKSRMHTKHMRDAIKHAMGGLPAPEMHILPHPYPHQGGAVGGKSRKASMRLH